MDWKTFLLSADGRISRQSFWIGILIILGVNVLIGWIPLIGAIVSLATIYVSVCLYAKRLHDMGRSGWLQLIPYVVFLIAIVLSLMALGVSGAVAALSNGDEAALTGAAIGGVGVFMLTMSISGLVGLAFLLWVGLTPGQPAANRYGEPPGPGALPTTAA